MASDPNIDHSQLFKVAIYQLRSNVFTDSDADVIKLIADNIPVRDSLLSII